MAEPTGDATEPETKTDEPAALKSRQRQSLRTKLSNQSRKNQLITILRRIRNGSERHCKDAIKEPADPAAVDKGTVVNYLDTPKALEDFVDVLAGSEHGWQPFVKLG